MTASATGPRGRPPDQLDRRVCGGGEHHRCDQPPDERGAAERFKANVAGARARSGTRSPRRAPPAPRTATADPSVCGSVRNARPTAPRSGGPTDRGLPQASPALPRSRRERVKRPQHCGECAYDRDRGRPERPRLQSQFTGDGVELMTIYFPIHTASTRRRRAGSGRACRSSPDRTLLGPFLAVSTSIQRPHEVPHTSGLIHNIFYLNAIRYVSILSTINQGLATRPRTSLAYA